LLPVALGPFTRQTHGLGASTTAPETVHCGADERGGGAPRPMKMGTTASPWRYDFTRDSTPVYPMPC
jgi:hypothetical protein